MGVWRHRRQHWWLGKKLAVGICSDDERCANFPCPVLPDPYPNILPNTLRLLRDAKTELKFPSPLNNCVWHIGETVWTNQNSSFFPPSLAFALMAGRLSELSSMKSSWATQK